MAKTTFKIWTSILLSLLLAFCSVPHQAKATNGIYDRLNFQGKVVNADGTNVSNGTYNFVFKVYDGASSSATALWTELWTTGALWSSTMSSAPGAGGESLTYTSNNNESTLKSGQTIWNINKGEAVTVTSVDTSSNTLEISPTRQTWGLSDAVTNRIYVKDGVLSIQLNSLNDNWDGVNWSSDTLFLGVSFNNDEEMKPRKRLTAVPYAHNANSLGGLTFDSFLRSDTSDNFTSGTLTLDTGTTFDLRGILIDSTGNLTIEGDVEMSGKVGIGTTSPNSSLHVAGVGYFDNEVQAGAGGSPSDAAFTWRTDQDTGMFQPETDRLAFATAGSEQVRIDDRGRVGIGTTNPKAKIEVEVARGGKMVGLLIDQRDSLYNRFAIKIRNKGAGDSIRDDSGARLTATGVWADASDISRKDSVLPLDYGLKEVMLLNPVSYSWKETGARDFGFVAQDVKDVLPEIVHGEEGDLSLAYSHLAAVLTKAIQEQQEQINLIFSRLDELPNDLPTLEEPSQPEKKEEEVSPPTNEVVDFNELKEKLALLEAKLNEFVSVIANTIETVTLKVTGTLWAKSVETEQIKTESLSIAGDETIGSGAIQAGNCSVTIGSSSVTENSKIFITFTSDYAPATRFWVTEQIAGKSFAVELDATLATSATFNWWVVN